MGVEVIGAGMDWNNPYSCEQWSEKHNITYPLLDDSRGERIYNYFGNEVVPYNIVIDRNGKLIYSAPGFNKDEIVNAIKVGLKASSKPINSEFKNILEGLQEIRKHESMPIIADIIFEYEKFIRLPLAEKHDKISIMLESIKGVIGHYKHKQN